VTAIKKKLEGEIGKRAFPFSSMGSNSQKDGRGESYERARKSRRQKERSGRVKGSSEKMGGSTVRCWWGGS